VHDVLPFVITGLTTGAIYGLFGVGLVLTYKTSGIFNVAHGAIATAAAYLFYFLHVQHSWWWVPAAAVSVLVAGPLIGIIFQRMAARLSLQRTAYKIVATVGVILLVQALAVIKFGSNPLLVRPFLPGGRKEAFQVAGVRVSWDQLEAVLFALAAVSLLYAVFRLTKLGVTTRAVVEDADLAAMRSVNPVAVRRLAWITGSTFAAASGVLFVNFVGVDSIALTFLVVTALGAAAVGAFSSIPLTFLGALAIGVIADISKKYTIDVPLLNGLPDALPFIILFIALLVTPRRKLVTPSVHTRPKEEYRTPLRIRGAMGVVLLVPLLFIPQIVDTKLPFFMAGLCSAMMLLSLGLLVRTSGQVSLCHATFAAIGAVAFAQFNGEHAVPFVLAVLLAGLVAVPVGAIVAIPAIRLSGLFLALATLGFGVLVQKMLYNQEWMFTALGQGRVVHRPWFASTPSQYYYVILAGFVVTAIIVTAINESRFGRLLRGMSESPIAVTAMGLSTIIAKVIIFCISAFLAAVAGALLGVARGNVLGGDVFYLPFTSLVLLATLAIAPFAEPWYALVPAVAAILPGYLTGAHTTDWLNALFGLSAIFIAVQGGQPPMSRKLRQFLDRIGGRRSGQPATGSTAPTGERPEGADHGLEVEAITVRFGGLAAVDGVTLEAPVGVITGLIGPNGAGKTTTFDVCSGLNRRHGGTVHVHGRDVTSSSPDARARLGLGRTFQRVELGDTLTVFDNVLLGREAGQAGANVLRQLVARPTQQRSATAAAWAALELCDIGDLADRQVGNLPIGQRRLVELARCLAGPFDVLLLDEPSSGLDHEETARFGTLLERVVRERQLGILLVEHDIELVTRVCDHIFVLDFGRVIFQGTADELLASDVVRAAYLGSASPVPEGTNGSGKAMATT
jgi:ABC-type branched-subunit amino acid transport system ATPase component/branched-subunit amino acid ABC-type transport system permease component